jgi:hypothetical protein
VKWDDCVDSLGEKFVDVETFVQGVGIGVFWCFSTINVMVGDTCIGLIE